MLVTILYLMPQYKILVSRLKPSAFCQEKLDLGPKQLDFEVHVCLFLKEFQSGANEAEGKLFALVLRTGFTQGDRKQAMKLM